ncbi:TPA: hypothetical protein U5D93_003498 [Yersinia enterocolitica]|nr:hypothetical protein [Yersinia enterocolitica]HDL8420929.1 hypothetical protein [Yersinia enterocolitica]HEN3302916.1 hypothetical protein [Yersinia enterocolitica]HEN3393376.1 hypothetical protein [Yersinia enterocolitica]
MTYKLENKKISDYQIYLKEKSRPPSRGGNTKALHQHVVTIDGEQFSFLANDSKKWIFKSDKVSFDYVLNGVYKNIERESIVTTDKNGVVITRGNRFYHKKLRVADSRLPGSRRECRD